MVGRMEKPPAGAPPMLKSIHDAAPLVLEQGGKAYVRYGSTGGMSARRLNFTRTNYYFIRMPDGTEHPINQNVVDGLKRRKIELEVEGDDNPLGGVMGALVEGTDEDVVREGQKLAAVSALGAPPSAAVVLDTLEAVLAKARGVYADEAQALATGKMAINRRIESQARQRLAADIVEMVQGVVERARGAS